MTVEIKNLARNTVLALPALLAVAVVSACQSGIRIEAAPIHEVDVSFAESLPVQVFVRIRGGLRGSGTVFHDLTVERGTDDIIIAVTTGRPKNAAGQAVCGYFEKNVALGSNFEPGRTYALKVNDFSTTFIYPF